MKSGELVKRAEKRAEAEKELTQAQEQGIINNLGGMQFDCLCNAKDSLAW